jgi:hypothetical protein
VEVLASAYGESYFLPPSFRSVSDATVESFAFMSFKLFLFWFGESYECVVVFILWIFDFVRLL